MKRSFSVSTNARLLGIQDKSVPVPYHTICLRASTSGSSFWSSAGFSEIAKTMLGECRFCNSIAILPTKRLLLGMDRRDMGVRTFQCASWLVEVGSERVVVETTLEQAPTLR